MYIKDGIAYAGEQVPAIRVSGVRPLEGFKLWVRFNTGESKVVDFMPFLSAPGFVQLKDEAIFKRVYIDYGITVWCDGEIDIAPETLYERGVSTENYENPA